MKDVYRSDFGKMGPNLFFFLRFVVKSFRSKSESQLQYFSWQLWTENIEPKTFSPLHAETFNQDLIEICGEFDDLNCDGDVIECFRWLVSYHDLGQSIDKYLIDWRWQTAICMCHAKNGTGVDAIQTFCSSKIHGICGNERTFNIIRVGLQWMHTFKMFHINSHSTLLIRL